MLDKMRELMASTMNLAPSLSNQFDSRKMIQSDQQMAEILDEETFSLYIQNRETIYDLGLEYSEMNTLQRSLYCLLLAQAYVSGIIMVEFSQKFNKDNVIVDSVKAGNASMGFNTARTIQQYINMFEEKLINQLNYSGYDYTYNSSFDINFAGKDGYVDGEDD